MSGWRGPVDTEGETVDGEPTVWSRFEEAAQRFPDNLAVVDERYRLTYRELYGLASALGGWLREAGASGNGGLLLPNGAGFFAGLLGVVSVPATCVPMNLLLTPGELTRLLEHAQVETVLTVRPLAETLPGTLPHVVCLDELLPTLLARAGSPAPPPSLPGADDVAAIVYTSGTSADPKGVMLSHRNFTSNVAGFEQVLDLHDGHVVLGVLPTFHCFALSVTVLLPLFIGAAAVQLRKFSPATLLQAAERHRASVLPAVPGILAALVRWRGATEHDLSALQLCISGAEPLARSIFDAFEERFGRRIIQGYGLTECSPVVSVNPPHDPQPGTVGLPLPGLEVEVRGPEGIAPAGEVGEVFARGPSVMVGYYRNPEATKEAIDEDGWLHTGDLGYFDDRGHLVLCGRRKELIIVGGENVFPGEVEEVLAAHPAVVLAAVVGVKDPLRGEVPRAYVTLEPGAGVTEMELRQHCRERLAPFKVPREVQIRESLPVGLTGKVLKRELLKGE